MKKRVDVGELARFPHIGDMIYDTLNDKIGNFYRHAGYTENGVSVPMTELVKDFANITVAKTNATGPKEIRIWCQQQFGNNWIWNFDTYYFVNPEDATLFALRWVK